MWEAASQHLLAQAIEEFSMRFRDWVSRLAHSYPAHSMREFFPELITASRRNQS